jgi:hypothetical protein
MADAACHSSYLSGIALMGIILLIGIVNRHSAPPYM